MLLAFGPFLVFAFQTRSPNFTNEKGQRILLASLFLKLNKAGKGLVDLGDNLGHHAEELIDMALLDA